MQLRMRASSWPGAVAYTDAVAKGNRMLTGQPGRQGVPAVSHAAQMHACCRELATQQTPQCLFASTVPTTTLSTLSTDVGAQMFA